MSEKAARFHICDLIGVYQRKAMGLLDKTPALPDGGTPRQREHPVDGIIEVLEFLTGEEISGKGTLKGKFNSFALEDAMNRAGPYLEEKFPWLARIPGNADLSSPEKVAAFVSKTAEDLGVAEWQDVEPMPPQEPGTQRVIVLRF